MDQNCLIADCARRLRGNQEALRQAEAPDFEMVVYWGGAKRDEADDYRKTLRENIALDKASLQQLGMGHRYVP